MALFDRVQSAVWSTLRSDGGELLKEFSLPQSDLSRAQKALNLPHFEGLCDELNKSLENFGKHEDKAAELLEKASAAASVRSCSDMDAVLLYSHAIREAPFKSPTLVAAFRGRADALLRLKEVPAALSDFRRIMALTDPQQNALEFARAQMGASACFELRGDSAGANELLRSALLSLKKDEGQEKAALKSQLASEIIESVKRININAKENADIPDVHHSIVTSGLDRVPALLHGPHATLPSASSAVELLKDQQRGRHLVAAKDIPAGGVLMVERPFAWRLSGDALPTHCLHCCSPVLAALPCPGCSNVSFCNESCLDASLASYHMAECPVLSHLDGGKELSVMALLVFRVVVTAAEISPGLLDSSEPTTLQLPKEFSNAFKDDGHKRVKINGPYRAVYQQITHSASRTPADLLMRAVTAVYLAKVLSVSLNHYKVALSAESELALTTAFLRHLQSCSCNAYQISEHVVPKNDLRSAEGTFIGGAVYSSVSLINHSCDPNVVRHSHGNLCIVRAVRKIRQGEELLDNYGPHFLEKEIEDRQLELEKRYFFRCKCRACENDWPTLQDLRLQPVAFRCSYCGQKLSNFRETRQCSRCKKKINVKHISEQLASSERLFSSVVPGMLEGREREALKAALEYAADLDESVIYPSWEHTRTGQVILLCWNLLGNKVMI